MFHNKGRHSFANSTVPKLYKKFLWYVETESCGRHHGIGGALSSHSSMFLIPPSKSDLVRNCWSPTTYLSMYWGGKDQTHGRGIGPKFGPNIFRARTETILELSCGLRSYDHIVWLPHFMRCWKMLIGFDVGLGLMSVLCGALLCWTQT